jgi:hypothetical protein
VQRWLQMPLRRSGSFIRSKKMGCLIRSLRTACVLIATGVLLAGCVSPIPGPAAATPTPRLGDALRDELGSLQTCLENSTTTLSATNAVCYQGFSYALDAYTWPPLVGGTEAALRTAGLTLATCLGGTAVSTCAADVTAFDTDRDHLLGSVP